MKQLYIIGNGFDIHHSIPSSYKNYHDWLEENDEDIIERLRNYYDVDEDEWWNELELELGHADMADYILQNEIAKQFGKEKEELPFG